MLIVVESSSVIVGGSYCSIPQCARETIKGRHLLVVVFGFVVVVTITILHTRVNETPQVMTL